MRLDIRVIRTLPKQSRIVGVLCPYKREIFAEGWDRRKITGVEIHSTLRSLLNSDVVLKLHTKYLIYI